MKAYRIWGIILRYLFAVRRSGDRLADIFYWPTMDLFLWGLTGSYFNSLAPDYPQVLVIITSGIVFWIVTWRAQSDVTIGILEELWSRNLVNLFGSPIKFSEWLVAVMTIGFLKMCASFTFAAGVAYLLYETNIFIYGFYIIPFMLLLMMSGWWVGLLICGLIFKFGTRVQNLAWSAIMVLAPFAAIYYPVSVLPAWAQKVSALVPMSYIFEGAREVIAHGVVDPKKIIICFILNVIYLILALAFIKRSYQKILEKGLLSLY